MGERKELHRKRHVILKWYPFPDVTMTCGNASHFKYKEMKAIFLTLLLLLVGRVVDEQSSRSMMLNIETDKSFSPSDLSTLLSQSLVLTSLTCTQLCLVSSDCQVATYDTSDSSCSIYNVNVSAGSLISSFSHTTYLVISVFPPHIPGKRRCIF
jgi:uncharacterized membrane protein